MQLQLQLLSVREAARLLGVTDRTLHRWCERGEVRFVRVAGRKRIPVREIERLACEGGRAEDARPCC